MTDSANSINPLGFPPWPVGGWVSFAQGDADLEAPGLESFAASVSASDGAKAVGTGLFG